MSYSKDSFIKDFYKNFDNLKAIPIVLYGVGQFTKWIIEDVKDFNIIGLMDTKTIGQTIYGYKVLTEVEVISFAKVIIIVSNLSVADTIYERIQFFTEKNGIKVFYLNGLQPQKYDISIAENTYWNKNEEDLKKRILEHEVISFDVFDTLIMRKCQSPEDIFSLLSLELERDETKLEFSVKRKSAEKKCYDNITKYFNFNQIYDVLYKDGFISLEEKSLIMNKEKELEFSLLVPRYIMCELLRYAKTRRKIVVLTSDMYFDSSTLSDILHKNKIYEYDALFISSEINRDKYWGSMWEYLKECYPNKKILHIGDNKISDEKTAIEKGISTYRIASAMELLKLSGIKQYLNGMKSIGDKLLVGAFIEKAFNNPFCMNVTKGKLYISNMYDFGYLFVGPLVLIYLFWLIKMAKIQKMDTILFVARDGYILEKIYEKLVKNENLVLKNGIYFLSSRRAASVASIEKEEDIWFIFDKLCSTASVKYEKILEKAFGISISSEDIYLGKTLYEVGKETLFQHTVKYYGKIILENAKRERENYQSYLNTLSLGKNIGFVNFICRGVTQYCISKVMKKRIKGFYFAAEEDLLDIYPKVEDIFCFYKGYVSTHTSKWNVITKYLFGETIFSAKEGQLICFEEGGTPVFSERKKDFSVIEQCHQGIEQYVDDMIKMVPNLSKHAFSIELVDEIFGLFGLENVILSEEVKEAFYFEDFYGE